MPGAVRARLFPPPRPPAPESLPKAWLTHEEEALVPPRSLWIGPRSVRTESAHVGRPSTDTGTVSVDLIG